LSSQLWRWGGGLSIRPVDNEAPRYGRQPPAEAGRMTQCPFPVKRQTEKSPDSGAIRASKEGYCKSYIRA